MRRTSRPAILALLLALAACAQGGERSAEALYRSYCGRCHAADGKGDPRSLPLYPNLDLTRSALVRDRARGALYSRIAEGIGPMPGFSHRLEHSEIESLVDFVLRFQPRKAGK
ncbi:MAG TPA: cytochrome c [Thermoanaerobaculia bacterium]|nr:cytochrome c [Thermoanaerobaculia bacterium]